MAMRRWGDGTILSKQPLADVCEETFGAPYYHFYRPDLLAVLAAGLPAGIVQLGHRCVASTQDEDRVVARFETGVTVRADVLIGADGIHSTVREQLFGPSRHAFPAALPIVDWCQRSGLHICR